MSPAQLAVKLRSQAHAMKAGPNSLLVLAADTIEAQERTIIEREQALLRAAQLIAVSTLAEGLDPDA